MRKLSFAGKSLKAKKGLTLIELLVGIGIAAVIVVMALNAYQSTNNASKVSQAVKDLGSLNAGVKSAFASSPNYAGITNAVAYQLGVVPTNLQTGTPAIDTSYGAVNILVGAAGTPGAVTSNRMFSIDFNALPQEACVKLATQTQSSAQVVDINGTVVRDMTLAPADTQATIAEITANCVDGSANVITWVFR